MKVKQSRWLRRRIAREVRSAFARLLRQTATDTDLDWLEYADWLPAGYKRMVARFAKERRSAEGEVGAPGGPRFDAGAYISHLATSEAAIAKVIAETDDLELKGIYRELLRARRSALPPREYPEGRSDAR